MRQPTPTPLSWQQLTNGRQMQAVIFDHDGTLVDSEPTHLAMWQSVLSPLGADLDQARYRQHLAGLPTNETALWLVEQYQLPIAAQQLYELKTLALKRHLTQRPFPLMPGAQSLLSACARSALRMAVASGARCAEVTRSLRAHEIEHYFEAVATGDDVVNNKPAPDVYWHAARALGVAPEACVAIEDTDSGQTAAIAAGMTCLRLRGFTRLPPHDRCLEFAHLRALSKWWPSAVS